MPQRAVTSSRSRPSPLLRTIGANRSGKIAGNSAGLPVRSWVAQKSARIAAGAFIRWATSLDASAILRSEFPGIREEDERRPPVCACDAKGRRQNLADLALSLHGPQTRRLRAPT